MQTQIAKQTSSTVFQIAGSALRNGIVSTTARSQTPQRFTGFRKAASFFAVVATLTIVAPAFGGEHWTTQKCHYCKHKTCKLKVETETEKVSCFEVECKDVCIPPITFPWQCRPTSCGKVRTVHVLKPESKEKQVCKYSWEIVTICPSCSSSLKAAGCDVAPGVIQGWCDDLPVDQHQ